MPILYKINTKNELSILETENNTSKSIESTTKTQRKINEFTRRKIIKKREGGRTVGSGRVATVIE